MLLTEEQAKEKWCPFARTIECDGIGGTSSPRNRVANAHEYSTLAPTLLGCRCIASDCMSWRVVEARDFKARADAEFERTGKRMREPDTGYCGLAGQVTP